MQSKSSNLGYVPELDGLRGVAISAVMVYHAKASFLKGGFIGVDIFFVLSGFLITSLLVREFNNTQHIDLRNFYFRRVLRLAPALVFFLASFASLSILLLDRDKAQHHLIDTFIALFYFTNWAWALNVHVQPPHFLAHTWSLSIEEQFYILWPMLLIALLRFTRSRKHVVLVITLLVFSSWLMRIYLAVSGSSVSRLYNGLDTRADDLLVGCLLGVILSSNLINEYRRHLSEKALKVLAPLCAISLVSFCVLTPSYQSMHMYYWGFFVVAVLTAIIIADIFVSSKSLMKQLLSIKLLVWIGNISYGLYLWHYPIDTAMHLYGFRGIEIITVGSCFTFFVASASYYFLERPFLKLKNRLAPNASHNSLPLPAVSLGSPAADEAGALGAP
jgi:peptidoglycan/LPS O-acetylase OafA/YrhL